MITGDNGIARKIINLGYDEDEVIELLMTVSSINGIQTITSDDAIIYRLIINDTTSCPMFTVAPPWYSFRVHKEELPVCLEENGLPPFAGEELFKVIDPMLVAGQIPIETALQERDNIVIAVYRLVHQIRYHD